MITLTKLEEKLPITKAVLFTLLNDDCATEIWIKFKDGTYLFIDFEQPFPKRFELQKLVGAGNALNCSEAKKDMLIQIDPNREQVLEQLKKSIHYKANIEDTVLKVIQLANKLNDLFF